MSPSLHCCTFLKIEIEGLDVGVMIMSIMSVVLIRIVKKSKTLLAAGKVRKTIINYGNLCKFIVDSILRNVRETLSKNRGCIGGYNYIQHCGMRHHLPVRKHYNGGFKHSPKANRKPIHRGNNLSLVSSAVSKVIDSWSNPPGLTARYHGNPRPKVNCEIVLKTANTAADMAEPTSEVVW